MSTKDATHKARFSKMSQIVEISEGNACPLDRSDFLTNYTNKQSCVSLLACKLELVRTSILCLFDADTTIVKTSLPVQDKPGTNILCLLLYRIYYSNNKNEIYIKNIQIRSSKDERVTNNIHDVINSTEKEYFQHLLFFHAFRGCITTSQIHNFGKKSIFSKLKIFKDKIFQISFTKTVPQLII